MKKYILALAVLFLGSAASANSCLEDATNSELLNELSERLYTSEPSGSALLNATCSGWNVKLSTVNVDTDEERDFTLNAGGSAKCENIAAGLSDKVGNQILRETVVIGTCSGWNLTRTLVKTNGEIKALDPENTGGSAKCEAAAERINSRW